MKPILRIFIDNNVIETDNSGTDIVFSFRLKDDDFEDIRLIAGSLYNGLKAGNNIKIYPLEKVTSGDGELDAMMGKALKKHWDFKVDELLSSIESKKDEVYTRKEVLALLKRQIRASATSVGRMEANPSLWRLSAYADEQLAVHKRLVHVKPIKF